MKNKTRPYGIARVSKIILYTTDGVRCEATNGKKLTCLDALSAPLLKDLKRHIDDVIREKTKTTPDTSEGG